jgi:2-oxoglutarate dehydrogenase E1 component
MTPKSLLRNPLAASTLDQLTTGEFQAVLDDPRRAETPESVTRLVLCSGKLAVELDSALQREEAADVAIARVERLAPFPEEDIICVLGRYPNLTEIVWAQEEPRNMGAWTYVEPRLRELLQGQGQEPGDGIERPLPLRYAGRPERASPAEGLLDRHGVEQARIIQAALMEAPSVTVAANGRGRGEKTNGAARNGARTKATRAKASQR